MFKYPKTFILILCSILFVNCAKTKSTPSKVSLRFHAPVGTIHKQVTSVDTKWTSKNNSDTSYMKLDFQDELKVSEVSGDTMTVDYRIERLKSEVLINGQLIVMDTDTSTGSIGLMFGLMTKLKMFLKVGPQYNVMAAGVRVDSLGNAMSGILSQFSQDSVVHQQMVEKFTKQIEMNMEIF